MAKTTEAKKTRSRPVLLVGAGRKPKELGACLAAVDSVRAQMDGEDSDPSRYRTSSERAWQSYVPESG